MAKGDFRQWLLIHVLTPGHEFLQTILESNSQLDWKWLGVFLWAMAWLYWAGLLWGHGRELDERVSHVAYKWLMVLGLDLAILAAYQHTEWWLFVVIFFVALNGVFTKQVFKRNYTRSESYQFTAMSVFEDISQQGNLLMPSAYLVGQNGCILFVVYASLPTAGQVDVCYLFWLMSIIVVQICGIFGKKGASSQLGCTWNMENDYHFLQIAGDDTVEWRKKNGDTWPVWQLKTVRSWQLRMRCKIGFFVNTILRDLLAFLIPILLLQSNGASDFLQNAFFIGFITVLDDYNEGVELEIRNGPEDAPSTRPQGAFFGRLRGAPGLTVRLLDSWRSNAAALVNDAV